MNSKQTSISNIKAWGILLLLGLIWGTSYILIKKGLIYFSPIEVACLRLSISFIAFLPFFFHHLNKVKKSQLSTLLLVGITGTALPSILFPLAQQWINSSLSGILSSLTPLFTLFLGLLFFKASSSWAKIAGILLGLVGAISLFAFGDAAGMTSQWAYGLLIVLACICYAISSNLVGFHLRGLNGLTISAVSFTMVGIPMLIYLLTGTDFLSNMTHVEGAWLGLGYISILALFSTVLASVLFFQLVQWTSPVFSSTVSYIVPAVAIGWGAIDGEAISWVHFFAMGIILVGVYLTREQGKTE